MIRIHIFLNPGPQIYSWATVGICCLCDYRATLC